MANNNSDRYTPTNTQEITLGFQTAEMVPPDCDAEDTASEIATYDTIRASFDIEECEAVYVDVIDAMEDMMEDGRSVRTLVLGADEFSKILALATKDTYFGPGQSPNMVDIVKEYIGVYTDCEIVVVPGSQISPVGRAADTVQSHVEEHR